VLNEDEHLCVSPGRWVEIIPPSAGIEIDQGRLHVRRATRGTPSIHSIRGDEIRALRKLRRDHPGDAYVFISERGGPMSTLGWPVCAGTQSFGR